MTQDTNTVSKEIEESFRKQAIDQANYSDTFQPRVVGKLPKQTSIRKSTISDTAVQLAEENPNEWVLAFSEMIEDSGQRNKKRNSLYSSAFYFTKTKGNGWQTKVMTRDNKVELYLIKEDRSGTDWQ